MRRLLPSVTRTAQTAAIVVMALSVYLGLRLWWGEQPVHALPEYAPRTGEPCVTCHVSAGGGGPRTMRGLLWAARGRPDEVPALPSDVIAPGVEDGQELYDVACAGCHGFQGEGLFGINLADRSISPSVVRSFVINGIPELGMPAFEGQFTDEQLQALTQFVTDMGEGQAPPDEYPLPAPEFNCMPVTGDLCGGE